MDPAEFDPIPLDLVLSGRDVTEPRPSPDGRSVAFVQRWRSSSAILVVPAHGGCERLVATPVDPAPGRGTGGGCFAWVPDSRALVYSAVDGEIWEVGLDGSSRRLTSWERSARAPHVATDGSFVVVAVDEAEVWMVDRSGGPTDLHAVRLDDGADEFCFDPCASPDMTQVAWQGWSPPDMPWDGSQRVTVHLSGGVARGVERSSEGPAVQQPRYHPDGRPLGVRDGTGWLNVHLDARPVVDEPFEHAAPTWGMGQRSYAASPDGTRIAYNRNEKGHGRLCVADVVTGRVTSLGRGVHGQIEWSGDSITALRSGARTPTQIVRYDGDTGERSVLAVGPAAAWDALDLTEPELLSVEHDGAVLHARRYVADRGRMLCWVHGGPTDQWPVEFRPRISYWWSRGWDVLVVDPRGTTGHGRAYQRALNGAWGRLDVDDTAALITHAHEQGWAAPQTTAVMGGSSGGLTVLGVLADHSHLVGAGVASYPVSDLGALAEVTHRFEAHYTDTLVGPSDDVALFERMSPLHRAALIRGPLLVFHGADDPVVPVEQSRSLAAAIESAGGSVEFVEYEGEGHGFRDPANVRDEYARTEAFLSSAITSSAR